MERSEDDEKLFVFMQQDLEASAIDLRSPKAEDSEDDDDDTFEEDKEKRALEKIAA